jgi:hypothetical protein
MPDVEERTGNIDMATLYGEEATSSFTEDQLFLRESPWNTRSGQSGSPFPDSSGAGALPKAGKKSSRKLIIGLGAAFLICFALIVAPGGKKNPSETARDVAAPAPAAYQTGEAALAAAPQEAPVLPPSREEIARATPAAAALSFSVGDYQAALRSYRVLESRHPENPAFPVIVLALEHWAQQKNEAK